MVPEPDLSTALTLGVAIPLPTVDAEVLKQRFDALVVAVEAIEEKAATTCCRVLAIRQLLDEEQSATAILERQATAKKLLPGSTSFSTMETATASSSYIDPIVTNLHIQVDTMMEEIHLDTSGLAAAPTAFYSNKMLSAPLSAPRPPGKNNDSGPVNGNGSNNNCIGTTTAATVVVVTRIVTMVETVVATPPWFPTSPPPTTAGVPRHGRHPSPWPTSVDPSQGHITMYPGPSPTGQQRSQAFMATTGPYTLPGFVPGPQQLYQ
jgi:hypothetical protein